jgi:hypothetical protein
MIPRLPKCRVNWNKPYRTGTICNFVDECTNECNQTDWKRCPCGGIVRSPRFEGLPLYPQKERDDSIRKEGREEALNDMRDAIRNTKKAGTIEPEEMFHWTGIIAIIDELREKEK